MAIAKRDTRKELFWQRMIREQASSGQSIKAWCRQQELSEARFYWWRRKLGRREVAGARPHSAGKASRTEFVPVHITRDAATNDNGQIEIILADGGCIRITGVVDPRMLTDVLELLERRVC